MGVAKWILLNYLSKWDWENTQWLGIWEYRDVIVSDKQRLSQREQTLN